MGSHHQPLVDAYIDCISYFLRANELIGKTALDIGCGDFNIGKNLVHLFSEYLAVDISEEIINFNKRNYNFANVEFKTMNLITESIPKTNTIFARQVFQHLSNNDIQKILDSIQSSCKFFILTEHIPAFEFKPNFDIISGCSSTRNELSPSSGVVITYSPFRFTFKKVITILDYLGFGGRILTQAYIL